MAGVYFEDSVGCGISGIKFKSLGVGCEFHDCEDIVVNDCQFQDCNVPVKARRVKGLRAKGNIDKTSAKGGCFKLAPICYLVKVYLNGLKG